MRLSAWKSIVAFLSFALFCAACSPEENQTEKTGHGEKDNSVHVTGISLNKTSATIIEGESIELEATVTPDNAENKIVLWSSDNNAVAAVNESGIVNAISEGKATITAKTEDAGKMATCMVTVKRNTALSITVGTDKLSAISVVLKGKANLPASVAADLKIGFQYSKSAGILPTNSTTVDAEDADADYNYTTGITGLDPETTYYFRSFVRQNGQDTYGETKSFTTPSLLETLDADNVSETKARMNAKLDLTNVQYKSLEYGFYWGTSESSQNTYVKCSNLSEAAFSYQLGGLTRNKQYYFKTRAKLDSRVFWGEVRSFTTNDIDATVETLDATEVSETKATLNGKLTVSSTETWQINVWFLYGNKETTLDELKSSGTKATSSLESDGSFYSSLSDLTRDNTYCYVAVTKVGDKEFYGELKTLKTKDIDASVTTINASEVGETKATLNGKLTVNSTETWQKSVWFLYSNEETTLEGLKSSGTKATSTLEGDSSFHSSLSDLIISTTYYYVSVAKVGDKDFYGEVKSFTTNDIDVSVETQDAADVGFTTVTLNGKLTVTATESVSKYVWFRYSDKEQTLDGLKSSGTKITSTLESDGSFRLSLSKLTVNTTYYFASGAKVGGKVCYGEVKSFTTNDIEATLETLDAIGVGAKQATLSCKLTVNTTETVSKSVWFLYSNEENALEGLKKSGKKASSTILDDGTYRAIIGDAASHLYINGTQWYRVNGIIIGDYLMPSSTYYYVAVASVGGKQFYSEVKSFTTKTFSYSAEAVDLGLSVKWSSMNLGASIPEEYGEYYAWGETELKGNYTSNSYKYYKMPYLTKYCTKSSEGTVDNKTTLDLGDDVAYVKLGGKWRMPTDGEWTELRNNCRFTWTSNYNGTGIEGIIVNSKKSGYTDKSIFFPCAGYGYDSYADGTDGGLYWSSSLETDFPEYAYAVNVHSGEVLCRRIIPFRWYGLSVRPVTK